MRQAVSAYWRTAKAVSGLQRRQAQSRTEHADRSCTGSRRTGDFLREVCRNERRRTS
nr:MAG TPA: hypothetical protein [Caudoviricetes sp.]